MGIIGIVPSSEIAKSKGHRLDAEFYLNKKIRCNLCGQEFAKFDINIDARKEKHEAKHLRYKGLPSQRDGHQTQNSSAKGKVVWEEIEN